MDVCTARLCLDVQANDSWSSLVFYPAIDDDDHVHHHLCRCRANTDRWTATDFILPRWDDTLEFLCCLHNEYVLDVYRKFKFVWQGLLSTLGSAHFGGDFQFGAVRDPVPVVRWVLRLVCNQWQRPASKFIFNLVLVAASSIGHGAARIRGRNNRLVSNDQVSGFG